MVKDPYENLRETTVSDSEIVTRFFDGSDATQRLWVTKTLPAGSRVLLHGETPVALYNGNADAYLLRRFPTTPAFAAFVNTSDHNVANTAPGGAFKTVNGKKFFEQYAELLLTKRMLRLGGSGV